MTPSRNLIRRLQILGCLVLVCGVASGCAGSTSKDSGAPESSSSTAKASGEDEDVLRPLPADPFPSWVGAIQSGTTSIADVTTRFGSPVSIEQSPSGGSQYHFVHAEIHWSDDDPMRPRVASDGTLHAKQPSIAEKVGTAFGRATSWLDRTMFFPPRQPRPQSPRMLPATIHDLWVDVAPDGTVRGVDYVAQQGAAPVGAR